MHFESSTALQMCKVLYHKRTLSQDGFRPGIMKLICQKSWGDSSGKGSPGLANKKCRITN